MVIAYHASASDPFYTSECAQRRSYYGNPGYPHMRIDGILSVIGGQHYGNMYPSYRNHYNTRIQIESPLSIDLTLTYDPDSLKGTVYANIKNTGTGTVSGNLHFILTETDIPYSWQGQSMLYDVVRDMLPDANGENISIASGDSTQKERDFSMSGSWVNENCKIIVFVQNASREIYQGAATAIVPETELTYYGLTSSEATGNGNGVPEPGESFELTLSLKNMGTEEATAISATLSTIDPYIIVDTPAQSFPDIPVGDDMYSSSPYAISIDGGCPDPHNVIFVLDMSANNFAGSDTFTFIVTSAAGFVDDMESGQGDWSHSGLNDPWHLTTHRSNSPTLSWYSGNEGSWQYGNEIDASLQSPYFVIAPSTDFRFYQYYRMETNYDYGFIEIDNGSGWWTELDVINGIHPSWSEEVYDLSSYEGQTVRARFRFITDPNTIDEGWYVDDVSIGVPAAKEENKIVSPEETAFLSVLPSGSRFVISFAIPEKSNVHLSVYDITGRNVHTVLSGVYNAGKHTAHWNAHNRQGKRVSCGVYFVRLLAGDTVLTEKTIVIQ